MPIRRPIHGNGKRRSDGRSSAPTTRPAAPIVTSAGGMTEAGREPTRMQTVPSPWLVSDNCFRQVRYATVMGSDFKDRSHRIGKQPPEVGQVDTLVKSGEVLDYRAL